MVKDSKFLERYSRMLALRDFDEKDLDAIRNTTISLVGAGGLGSPILILLTSIGFGRIRIIDRDIVDLSNLQRQIIYNTQDIGKPKVDAAVENLSKLNPEVILDPIAATLRYDNAVDLLEGSDIVIDGLDSMESRRAVNAACQKLGIPYIYAGALEYYGNVSTFIPHQTGCLHCLVGDMQDDPEATCANVGVSSPLLSMVASVEVREAVLLAAKKPPRLAGKLMYLDIDTLSFETFEISRMENCPICGKDEQPDVSRISEINVTMVCSGSFSISPPEFLSLDFDKIEAQFANKYHITRRLRSLILENADGIKITLMSRGNAVVEGVQSAEDAVSYYSEIVPTM
ncbi:MAG: ThiF family adenylyltransferase [Candidatus Thorarchaeota archaeon]